MKKILCIIICILTVVCFAGCGEMGDELSGEFFILELTEKELNDDIQFSIVDQSGKVWLENADVDKVYVSFQKSKDRYLELLLTDDGIKKFKKALKENENGVLSIAVGGEVLASPVKKDEVSDNSVIVTGEYEDIMHWFNSIT